MNLLLRKPSEKIRGHPVILMLLIFIGLFLGSYFHSTADNPDAIYWPDDRENSWEMFWKVTIVENKKVQSYLGAPEVNSPKWDNDRVTRKVFILMRWSQGAFAYRYLAVDKTTEEEAGGLVVANQFYVYDGTQTRYIQFDSHVSVEEVFSEESENIVLDRVIRGKGGSSLVKGFSNPWTAFGTYVPRRFLKDDKTFSYKWLMSLDGVAIQHQGDSTIFISEREGLRDSLVMASEFDNLPLRYSHRNDEQEFKVTLTAEYEESVLGSTDLPLRLPKQIIYSAFFLDEGGPLLAMRKNLQVLDYIVQDPQDEFSVDVEAMFTFSAAQIADIVSK